MSAREWSFMLFVVLSLCPLSLTAGNNFVNAFLADRRSLDGCSMHACLLDNDMRCIEGTSLAFLRIFTRSRYNCCRSVHTGVKTIC